MKQSLVDVPVKINIWTRPDCQKKQWDIVRMARPSILFLQSDGGRNEKEWEAIIQNRKMIDSSIDWNCTVYRLYEKTNLGLYAMAKKVSDFIWSKVDRCIFTEDDQVMSVSFFQYCAELLERYKDDTRIECICGMNHLGICDNVDSDYFFSRQGSIWGIATWKRVYRDLNFDYYNSSYSMSLLKQRTKHNKTIWKRLNAYGKGDLCENHVAGREFWIEFNMYSQNRLQIIPKYNMISNIGCTDNSEHSGRLSDMPRKVRKCFNAKTYEIAFPLNHPKYVIPDIQYEKKRNSILCYNEPAIKQFFRKLLKFLKHLAVFDFSYFKKHLSKRHEEK